MNLRETILSGLKLKFEDVPVTLADSTVNVRVTALNGTRMLAYRKLMKDRGKDEDSDDAGWVQMCFACCDPETGELLFTPDDVEFLKQNMGIGDAMELIHATNRVNGSARDVGKSSATTGTTETG